MGFFGKKRLTEPVRPDVEEAFYATRPNGSFKLRVIEREYVNGEVLYYPQEKFASSWADLTPEGFDTAQGAREHNAELYGAEIVSERVID